MTKKHKLLKTPVQPKNYLTPLGEKIFLDRYAWKDGSKKSLAVGDTVIVCVDEKTRQREIATVESLDRHEMKAVVRLRDDTTKEVAIEHIDKPLETTPDQTMARIARGIAAVETEAKQAEWQQKFEWLLEDWKFVPGGRIWAGAGTDQELTFYNCMPPSQEVLTESGYRPIAEVNVGDMVVTHHNRLRRVLHKFERETEEPIYHIRADGLSDDVLRLTGEHKIHAIRAIDFIEGRTEPQWIPSAHLMVGDFVSAIAVAETVSATVAVTGGGIAEIPTRFQQAGLTWSVITDITTEAYAGWVYDIEVDEDHSFISAGVVVSNCYVVPSPHDSRGGIVKTLQQMMEIMSRGGGVGINVSSLRPRYGYVKGVNGRSSGAVSWGGLYSFVTGLIEQGGSRRGALMLICNDWHPDVVEFINSKREAGKITNANISVGISDAFMDAVKQNADWDLVFPDTLHPTYDTEWNGDLEAWQAKGYPVIRHKTVKAKEMWNQIIESAWASAEPGLWFRDRANKMSNSWYHSPLICTNPCVTGDTLVSTEEGYIKARDLTVGMKIRTPGGLKPIEKLYNNGVQRIYRVEFSDGGYLEGTADHKIKVIRNKKYEWIAFTDLREGDKVLVSPNETFGARRELPQEALEYVAKRELKIANHFDRTLGFLAGVVIGDGTLRKTRTRDSHAYQCKVSFGGKEDAWLTKFTDLLTQVGIHAHKQVQSKDFAVGDGTIVTHRAVTLDCYKLATLMVKVGMTTNIKAPHKVIPEVFLNTEKEVLAGLLDGLFTTDGSVLMKQGNPMLRFHTSSYELAQQVRLILLQFGIHGRIYRAEREKELQYDGRSMYGTGEKFDVVIMNEGIARFYAEIGLSHPEKAARLKDIAENWHYNGGTWTASVVSVQDMEKEEEVFDLYEPDTLTWITNGYVSFDCGEQPLPSFGICNLGAVNLAKFVKDGAVEWESLGQTVRYATRFLDNVIDATPYFFPENAEQQGKERRVGLGVMGLAEMMIRLGLRYGSDEGNAFLDDLFKFFASQAYIASAENAAEKGSFPAFDAKKYLQSGFMMGMPEEVRETIREKGARNVTLLTVAPTGTTGTMVSTSTGVEPYYFWSYFRKSRLGVHEEVVDVVKAWRDENPQATGELPDYFVTAMDLSPEDHVKVQAVVQKWIDSSISKTCNVPNHYTVEQTAELYQLMYDLGCKGGTIYRDGSRDEQVLNLKKEDKKEEPKAATPGDHNVPVVDVKPTELPSFPHISPNYTNVGDHKRKRARRLKGATYFVHTPIGKAFVTVNRNGDEEPFEVFANVGKVGSEGAAMSEALGRLVSLVLRLPSHITPSERLEMVVEQLGGIGGARSIGFGANRVASLPDALAQVLREDLEAHRQDEAAILLGEADPEPQQLELLAVTAQADLCPECGHASFIRIEGCKKCVSCGHAEC